MNKTPAKQQPNHEVPFRVQSVVKTATPDGSEGTWFRYVIAQGTNQITGLRSGAEAEVIDLVRDMVERMNERRIGKSKPRGKPPQPTTTTTTTTTTAT